MFVWVMRFIKERFLKKRCGLLCESKVLEVQVNDFSDSLRMIRDEGLVITIHDNHFKWSLADLFGTKKVSG